MKIEKISDNKIKVRITNNDLLKRNIDITALNYNSLAAQELFWDMIEQAEIQFGFNTSDAQIVIEAAPESDGGYVILITKLLDEEDDFETIHSYIKERINTKRNLRIRKKRPDSKVYPTISLYSFDSFDDLCDLCKTLLNDYTGESTVYKFKETYYLMLTLNSFLMNSKILFSLGEYGNKILNTGFYEGFLNEYGTKLIPHNAVEIISTYF